MKLTYRDETGRALLTHYGKQIYCSTQATADCFAKLEDRVAAYEDAEEQGLLVPVRHGKWIELGKYSDGYNWRCSVCKRESVMAVNYCPFCGALMGRKIAEPTKEET